MHPVNGSNGIQKIISSEVFDIGYFFQLEKEIENEFIFVYISLFSQQTENIL